MLLQYLEGSLLYKGHVQQTNKGPLPLQILEASG